MEVMQSSGCSPGRSCSRFRSAAPQEPRQDVGGIHPEVVPERLEHATVSITLDTFAHAIPALREEAARGVAPLPVAGKEPMRATCPARREEMHRFAAQQPPRNAPQAAQT
jgi:hypothetical protein